MASHLKQFFYIAGLPRTGSSVLCAILNQNPKFHVSTASPLSDILYRTVNDWQNINQVKTYSHPDSLKNLWLHIQEGLYAHIDEEIIFDKSRAWHMRDPLESYRQIVGSEMKVICLVDSVPDILGSFIHLIERNKDSNNFIDNQLRKEGADINTENRCKVMLRSVTGSVGWCFQHLKDSYFSINRKNLHLIERVDLISKPEEVLKKLYLFIQEDYFHHELFNLKATREENDSIVYGMKNLHRVEAELYHRRYNVEDVLGPELYQRFSGKEFWRDFPL